MLSLLFKIKGEIKCFFRVCLIIKIIVILIIIIGFVISVKINIGIWVIKFFK